MEKSKIVPFITVTVLCLALIVGIFIGRSTNTYSLQTNTVPVVVSDNATENSTVGKLNINTAEADDFLILEGIGPAIAQRIVDYRIENGPFQTIEDIKNVKGIGEITFSKIADYITTGG